MRRKAAALAAWLLLAPAIAAADESCEDRVAFIQTRLERSAHRVTVWRWSWGVTAVTGAAAQLVGAAVVSDRATRINLIVGGVSTLALLTGVLFAPEVQPRDGLIGAPCPARLAGAERRLAEAGRSERAARSPWFHAGNVAFNVGVGLVLGLGYGHWVSGAINAGIGTVVGEVQLFTVPDDADVTLAPVAAPGALGAAVTVRF